MFITDTNILTFITDGYNLQKEISSLLLLLLLLQQQQQQQLLLLLLIIIIIIIILKQFLLKTRKKCCHWTATSARLCSGQSSLIPKLQIVCCTLVPMACTLYCIRSEQTTAENNDNTICQFSNSRR